MHGTTEFPLTRGNRKAGWDSPEFLLYCLTKHINMCGEGFSDGKQSFNEKKDFCVLLHFSGSSDRIIPQLLLTLSSSRALFTLEDGTVWIDQKFLHRYFLNL